jgi:thiol-disulfide isomerase/thioredoxin
MANNYKFLTIGETDVEGASIDSESKTLENIKKVVDSIKSGKNVFIFVFMEGCHPCMDTKPEWKNLENLNKENVVVVLLNQKLLDYADSENESYKPEYKELSIIGKNPGSYPTFIHVNKNGSKIANISRTYDDFKKWIKKNSMTTHNTHSEPNHSTHKTHNTHKNKISQLVGGGSKKDKSRNKKGCCYWKGGKWSNKYKKSINCKKPKGFSQRQYCKYGRKSRKVRN